jgi:hypothetical protein
VESQSSPEDSADYGYDLVHESLTAPVPPEPAHAEPTFVATTPDDADGGDYGYDLAHDVPPSTGR